MLVTTRLDLIELCSAIEMTGVVGFDTEFIAERTYWPRLGLVQLGAPGGPAGAVDPLALDDMSPVVDLLLSPNMTVVVHAGGMDWRILGRESGRLPTRTFDTQIAASFLGFGLQAGYGALVEAVLGRKIDKTETVTDWLKRPLTPAQVAYALGDVTHLMELHVALETALEERGRLAWAQEEFVAAVSGAHLVSTPDPRTRYLDVRRSGALGRRELSVLRELAAWRELEAQSRDVPPHFIIKDEVLLAMARRVPQSLPDLAQIRTLSAQEQHRSGAELLRCVARAVALPEAEWPEPIRSEPSELWLEPAINLMQAYVQTRCKALELASEVVASRASLKTLVRWGPDALAADGSPVLSGWRREVLGAEFVDLLHGRAGLGLEPLTRRVVVLAQPAAAAHEPGSAGSGGGAQPLVGGEALGAELDVVGNGEGRGALVDGEEEGD